MTTTDQIAQLPREGGTGRQSPGQGGTVAGHATSAGTAGGGRLPQILFPEAVGSQTAPAEEPDFFRDLNLDQIVAAITTGRESYDLKPFFYAPLTKLDQISFRHEIMRDLENEALFASLKTFSTRMHAMGEYLTSEQQFRYPYQKERALLSAAEVYCEAASSLRRDLDATGARSRGLLAIRDYLARYVESTAFQSLAQQARTVIEGLAAVRYGVLIDETNVTVRNYENETDFTAEVESTFAIFKQGAVKDYRVELPEAFEINHVESTILDFVAKLNPAAFAALDEFYKKYPAFSDQPILDFYQGIQFYLAYTEYMAGFKKAGLHFCYPQVSDSSKEIVSRNGFDLALAGKLVASNTPPVCNDFELHGSERIMVITGPNQGGKTTFARAFGQLHYLAALGLPVPGTEARLFLVDRFFTHFDSEENINNPQGKLKDDLYRMHRILAQATPKSLVVMNEIFASTSLEDATFLGKKVLTQFTQIDLLGVCVTFLDELTTVNEKIVSMMATIVPENPSQRTFLISRKSASGLSYAMALAEKYRLTYERLKERITR